MQWPIVSLCDVADITSSKRIYASDYTDTGIPFYRSKEIIELHNNREISVELYISERKFKEIEDKYGVPMKGELLLTSVGTLGIPYLITEDAPFYFKDGNLTWFRNLHGINAEFLYYSLMSPWTKRQFEEITIGSTQKALTIINLKNIKIYLPDMTIQNKIVNKLEYLDNKIKRNTEQIAVLFQIVISIFDNWFLDETKNCHWLQSNSKANISEIREKNKDEKDYPVLSVVKEGEFKASEDVFTKQVYSKSTKNYKIVRRNQVAYNPARANIGSIAMLNEYDVGLVSPIYTVFEMKDTITPIFFYYYMKQPIFQEMIKHHAIGTTRQNFPFEAFEMFPMVVPPMELQLKFEEIARPIEQKIAKLKEENEVLAEIRDTLLPKLMSGELPVEVGEK